MIRSLLSKSEVPIVLQSEAAECGLACLTMIAKHFGHDVDISYMRRTYDTSLRGITLERIIQIADGLSIESRPLRAELEYLRHAQLPCIAHWDMNHFVVISKVKKDKVTICDPARGKVVLSMSEVGQHFTGVILELKKSLRFEPAKSIPSVSLFDLTGKINGIKLTALQILGIALAIEMTAMLAPLQFQIVLDQILSSEDISLLLIVGAAFFILTTIQALLTYVRGILLNWLGTSLNSQWVSNLFAHLIKLPLDYFEKRSIGDISYRFTSIYRIQHTITGSFSAALLDGIFGLLSLCAMLYYSISLSFIVLLACLLYGVLRWLSYNFLHRVNEERTMYSAGQQSELLESIRGIQAIKLARVEAERKLRLENITIESAKRDLEASKIETIFQVLNLGLYGYQKIAIIFIGAHIAINKGMTPGMLLAFVAYSDQFSQKFNSLADKLVEFKMMSLHLDRISDIALAEPEKKVSGAQIHAISKYSIELENLGFRYSESDPWVLKNLNLSISEGEVIAIVGKSGCGKSTLAKLILALKWPTEGKIKIGEVDIHALSDILAGEIFAAVMQDDQLFSGTIASNIAFGDSHSKIENIIHAAEAAAIHNEIMEMPMTYETRVGDMGSALSGGQKQRILLARALYRKPKVLVLDEATSHLDLANEMVSNKTIKQLGITTISIAHRKETILQADRIFDLSTMDWVERESVVSAYANEFSR